MRSERIPLPGSDPRLYSLLTSLLEEGADVRIEVTGRSMLPTLSSGDVVLVKKADLKALKRGDIILVRGNSGSLLLHRLVQVRKSGNSMRLRTRGDAVRACDGWTSPENVLGKITVIEREKGGIVNLEGGLYPVAGFVAAITGNARSSVLTLLSKTKRRIVSGRR